MQETSGRQGEGALSDGEFYYKKVQARLQTWRAVGARPEVLRWLREGVPVAQKGARPQGVEAVPDPDGAEPGGRPPRSRQALLQSDQNGRTEGGVHRLGGLARNDDVDDGCDVVADGVRERVVGIVGRRDPVPRADVLIAQAEGPARLHGTQLADDRADILVR